MTLTKRRVYLDGALEARTFLCRTQAYVREFGQHRPRLLRQQLMQYTGSAYPPAFARRFVDMIGAYLSLALERSDIDPAAWDLMAEVERLR